MDTVSDRDRATKAFLFNPREAHLDFLQEVEIRAWSAVGKNITASREKLFERIASHGNSQTVVLATVNGEAAGSQYAFRFEWDKDVGNLKSWDEYTNDGWTRRVHRADGNTGFLVGVGVVPEFRRRLFEHNLRWPGTYRISELLIAFTLDDLFDKGAKQVIANARVPFYHIRPDLNIKEYCDLRREDGTLFDPVLRFHERMGARLIKPIGYSMEDEESLNAGCWVLYRQRFVC